MTPGEPQPEPVTTSTGKLPQITPPQMNATITLRCIHGGIKVISEVTDSDGQELGTQEFIAPEGEENHLATDISNWIRNVPQRP